MALLPQQIAENLSRTDRAVFVRYQVLGAAMENGDLFGTSAQDFMGANDPMLVKLFGCINECSIDAHGMKPAVVVAKGLEKGGDVAEAAEIAVAAYRLDRDIAFSLFLLKRDAFVRNMEFLAARIASAAPDYRKKVSASEFKKWTDECLDSIANAYRLFFSQSGLPELPMAPVGAVDPFKVIDSARLVNRPHDDFNFCGFPDIARLISMEQSVCAVAGPTSMGKTSYVLAEAYHTAKSGRPVLYASTEMPEEDVIKRLIGIENSDVPMSDLFQRRLQEIAVPKAQLAVKRMANMPFFYIDGLLSMRELRQIAKRLDTFLLTGADSVSGHSIKVTHNKLFTVYVDYLQQMDFSVYGGGKATQAQQISDAMKDARNMAKECDCRVVVVSQMNRDVSARKDKEPQLSDLKESSAIEQMSNTVMFLHREDYYDEPQAGDEALIGMTPPEDCYMIIRKNRNGPNNRKIPLKFIAERACYVQASYSGTDQLIDTLSSSVFEPDWLLDQEEEVDSLLSDSEADAQEVQQEVHEERGEGHQGDTGSDHGSTVADQNDLDEGEEGQDD